MEEINKKKNGCGFDKFEIVTDSGNFEVDITENGDLYVGLYNKEHMGNEDVSFIVDKENMYLYGEIERLYSCVMGLNPYDQKDCDEGPIIEEFLRERAPITDGKVDWTSDDYKKEESSHMIIEKDEENGTYKITFKKSTTKETQNTYFVKISADASRYHPFNFTMLNMYANMQQYEQKHRQIEIEEYLAITAKAIKAGNGQRSRQVVNK